MFLLTIPAPSVSRFHLGPIDVHLYGIIIALAILVGISLAMRFYRRIDGDPNEIVDLAVWAIPAGILGARLYHVLTDLGDYEGAWVRTLFVWDGGLGIWGAVGGGALAVWWQARRKQIPFAVIADIAAPALAASQAIGRWGNYFNQELFGKQTSLPWGLHVDIPYRPFALITSTTFHPTFLYESLACALIALGLFWLGRNVVHPGRGVIFATYVAAYCTVRLGMEALRVDDSP